MNLYQAGFYASNFDLHGSVFSRLNEAEKAARLSIERNLESYHYIHKGQAVNKMRRDGVKVFLDSGAFSSFTMGVKVDLPGYCRFIQQNEDVIEKVDGIVMASVLDAIGDPAQTGFNQEAMEKLGAKPLPCFHYGEPEEYLDYYVAEYDYITLGGLVPISTEQKIHWLDRIFEEHLCDGSGRLKTRVHAFGLTSLPLMKRYPWTSVDSSTWVQWAANGMILVPGVAENGAARQVNISEYSSSRKIENRHIHTLAPPQTERLYQLIESTGFTVDRLAKEYGSRWAFNAWAFQNEAKRSASDTFARSQPEIFNHETA